LAPRYKALDETFQKWAVWRHLARATGMLEEPSSAAHPRERDAAASD
jgi:hypothetical protein